MLGTPRDPGETSHDPISTALPAGPAAHPQRRQFAGARVSRSGGDPIFFKGADGAYLIDEDDKRYIDYVASWGPMVVGHGHPEVVAAVQAQVSRSLGFGAPTEIEIEMAELVCELVPSMEMVRMVISGKG